jgi:hypothetical protein
MFSSLNRRVGMSYEDAMTLMQRRRPTANPIPEFRALLQELAATKTNENTDVERDEETLTVRLVNDSTTTDVDEAKRTKRVEHDNQPAPAKKRVAIAMIGPQGPPKR